MDLLLYKLIQLRDAEWYQTLLDAVLDLGVPVPVEMLEQERRQLLQHPAFSMLASAEEAVEGAAGGGEWSTTDYILCSTSQVCRDISEFSRLLCVYWHISFVGVPISLWD